MDPPDLHLVALEDPPGVVFSDHQHDLGRRHLEIGLHGFFGADIVIGGVDPEDGRGALEDLDYLAGDVNLGALEAFGFAGEAVEGNACGGGFELLGALGWGRRGAGERVHGGPAPHEDQSR